MCSLDVCSLFTNVPLDETIDIALDKLYSLSDPPTLSRSVLQKLLEFATMKSHFLFDGQYYDQIDGVAMARGGGTPLYGLNGDVRPDRVWFSEDFVLNGVSISSIFVLNRVSLHDLMYSLTTEPSQKAKFLPVCQCSAY